MNHLLDAALSYQQEGYSVIGASNKQSYRKWRHYQFNPMTREEINQTFTLPKVTQIAVICGPVSGNLEVIDIDSKNDLAGKLYQDYCQLIKATDPALYSSLTIASTGNRGYHLFYKCEQVSRSIVLARRWSTKAELESIPNQKIKVLVETRGTGGYVITDPSDGYAFIQNDLFKVPIISGKQRNLLITTARSFNELNLPESTRTPTRPFYDPDSPFDDYDNRGDIIGLLRTHGWTVVPTGSKHKTYFRRPGITTHKTSGDFNHQLGLFGVFSSSTEFEVARGYRPHAVYAILECQGNFRLAAKRLLDAGYGKSYKQRRSS